MYKIVVSQICWEFSLTINVVMVRKGVSVAAVAEVLPGVSRSTGLLREQWGAPSVVPGPYT